MIAPGKMSKLIVAYFVMTVAIAGFYSSAIFCETTQKTMSLRTNDGLVVVDCTTDRAEELLGIMATLASPPSSNRDVYKWLLQYNTPADTIRIYMDKNNADSVSAGIPDMKWKSMDLLSAERQGAIPSISGLEIFEAYLMLRSSGFSVLLSSADVERSKAELDLKHTVFVLSYAFQSGYHGIYVDGKDHSRAEIGYNIVTIPPDGGGVDQSTGYSLYVDTSGGIKMAEFLNGLPDGTFVLASINHGPGVFLTGDAIKALHACGSAVVPDPEVLSSHAMIGKKGMPSGSAIEKAAVNAGSNIIYFNKDLFVDVSGIEKVDLSSYGRTVVLTGTEPGDRVFIYTDK